MSIPNLDRLAALIASERELLLSWWREQVRQLPSAKHLDVPTLNDHVPTLLDELATALRDVADQTIAETFAEGSPPIHGLERYEHGFDIVEVVAEYHILRGCIHDLAERNGLSLSGKAFHILNRVFDDAIGLAIQTFATQQALEVQKRRDEYLAFVTHDLRTPLNAIALATRMLESETATGRTGADAEGILSMLRRNVGHLESLIEKVLKESAHVQTEMGIQLECRTFDLWPLVESVIQDVKPVADTAGTTVFNRVPHDLATYADASLLRRIFQNLLANAITYTPRGEVVIDAREVEPAGTIECLVSDNGSGIPKDRLDNIFKRLETDPQKQGGTGLGLAIVKSFVEAQGGTVTVETMEGVGTTFRFTLPGAATRQEKSGPDFQAN
jgi:two-component system, OmpR family, phosphate regulon sensor histidine kinase PhoR